MYVGISLFCETQVHRMVSYKRCIAMCARKSVCRFVFHNLRTLFCDSQFVVSGIESIAMDMKDKKLTVIGDVDPLVIVKKLRKCGGCAILLTVGPDPKEEEKKKKEAEEKKKKEAAEKKKKEEEEEKKRLEECAAAYKKCYIPYNCPPGPPPCYPGPPPCYRAISCEENPNSCVIM